MVEELRAAMALQYSWETSALHDDPQNTQLSSKCSSPPSSSGEVLGELGVSSDGGGGWRAMA